MKILIVNRFFGGAQIPTGRMAEDVARVLVAGGHEVTALASSGAYEGAAQAVDQETKRPKDQKTGDMRRVDPPTRSPRQPTPAGQGALNVESVQVPKWMPRAVAWLWFTWQARKRIPRMDWDVCVLMTDPPLLPLLARGAARRRDKETKRPKDQKTDRRVAVWLMDLYPEALAASGRLSEGNPLYRWYFEKRQKALANADLLVCLGHTQKELLGAGARQSGVSVERCLPSAAPHAVSQTRLSEAVKTEKPKHCPTELPRLPDALGPRTVVVPPWDDRGNIALATEGSLKNLALYAGNLGEAHCFEEILAAVPFLPGDWKIRFAVRGAKAGALKEKAKGISHRLTRIDTDGSDRHAPPGLGGNAHTKVTLGARSASSDGEIAEAQEGAASLLVSSSFGLFSSLGAKIEITGYASEEETPGLLASARVHLITMSPGWEGIVVPSKLYGCIRTGRPVLFIGPEKADTAREILANDWGAVLPPGASGERVAAAILELAARPTKAPVEQRGAEEVAEQLQLLATAESSRQPKAN